MAAGGRPRGLLAWGAFCPAVPGWEGGGCSQLGSHLCFGLMPCSWGWRAGLGLVGMEVLGE